MENPEQDNNPRSASVSRRTFLGGTLSLTAAAAGNAASAAQPPIPSTAGKKIGFPLWCDKGGLIDPTEPGDEKKVRDFVRKCADHGVTRLFPWTGSRVLVEAAREKNIEVHPYLAFNSYGRKNVRYTWSVNYVGPPIGTPEAKDILDHHRPIWAHRRYSAGVSEFAKQHPEWWALDRQLTKELDVGRKRVMSLAVPEVRAYENRQYLSLLENTGGDGVQVEFISENKDEDGVAIFGYEQPMVAAYREKFGKSPLKLANNDPGWVQFRADQVTTCLRELRQRLKDKFPRALLSVTVIDRDREDYIKVGQDLPRWVEEGLIDEFYVWFRTTSDIGTLERHVKQAAEIIAGRVPLIAEISCYHPGSIQDPKRMVEAARRARASGADAVGIYRSHAVDQLDLWSAVEQIAQL